MAFERMESLINTGVMMGARNESTYGRTLRKNLFLPILALLLVGLLLGGCSRFSKDWRTALSEPFPQGSMAGPWEGVWISNKSGHRGDLRAIIEPIGTNRYRARFKATYQEILKFTYAVPLETVKTNGHYKLSGEANLGWWAGGLYRYEGHATADSFYSDYRADRDHGYFVLERPE